MNSYELSDGDKYINVEQLANFLGFKKNSIYVLTANGSLKDLPRYKVGKVVLFKMSEVEEFIKNSRVKK
jgi:excisionase family DNA binding protein